MSAQETVFQLVRTAIKDALSLTDAQVIRADPRASSARPPLPYLTVKVVAADVRAGVDELIATRGAGDAADYRARGLRRMTLSIQGFGGDTAAGWLEDFTLALALPTTVDQLRLGGVQLRDITGSSDAARLLDTAFESRVLREYEALYIAQTASDADAGIEADQAQVTNTYTGSDAPGDLTLISTVNANA